MSERPPSAWRRRLFLAATAASFAAALALIAAVSAWVTVRRSVSGRDVLVPDLAGLTTAEATRALAKQGLLVEQVAERYDPKVESGRILTQEPAAGTSIKAERAVKVIVSLGEKGAQVPELRGGAARGAQIILQQQGFRLGEQVYAYSRQDEESLVVAQDPGPGAEGARQERVSILVSRGRRPTVYVMPDLVGRPQEEVLRFLARAGLRAAPPRRAAAPGPGGLIVAQHPEAGFPVRTDDLVSLTVSGQDGAHD